MADNFETMNMMSVTVEQFTNFIREQLEDDDLTPVLGIGKSGIGKTESIYGLAKELGIGFCELRLVTLTEVDLLGVPIVTSNTTTTYASNELLPIEARDGERGILVLDEITSATATIRAAAYQLLDSKRSLGNYKLPDGWIVIALGNGPSDGGCYNGIEWAFLNRCRCLRVEPDLKSWKKWAVKHGANPSVLAFLSFMPEYLHKFDPEEMVGLFPSPRSWAGLSRMLNNREKRNNDNPLDRDSVMVYTSSCIGSDVASKFSAFYEYKKSVIDIEDIMKGEAKCDISMYERQVMYLTVQGLIKVINKEIEEGEKGFGEYSSEVVTRISNACKWIVGISEQSLDMAIMAIVDLKNNVPNFNSILMNSTFDEVCPEFCQFALANSVIYAVDKK